MVIDMHAHWLSRGLREWGWSLLTHRNAPDTALPLDGIDQENARNLRCMDERGIDVQILSIRPVAMLHHETSYIDIPWCRVFNNVLAEAVRRNPDRLRGMALLPQSQIDAAVAELHRAVRELGLVGAIVNPNPQGSEAEAVPLDDPHWDPLWQAAQELDVPLFLHGAWLRGPRFLRHRTAYLLGQTIEETMAGPTLVYGGVLHRYPRLKLILAHGGGAIPFQIGRFLTPPAREEGPTFGSAFTGGFLEGFRQLYFDGTLYTPEALLLLIRVVGAERVLFGTETPGRGTFTVSGRLLDDLVPVVRGLPISEEEKRWILEANARKVFKLG